MVNAVTYEAAGVYTRTSEKQTARELVRRMVDSNEIRAKNIRTVSAYVFVCVCVYVCVGCDAKKTETAGTLENRRNKIFALQRRWFTVLAVSR